MVPDLLGPVAASRYALYVNSTYGAKGASSLGGTHYEQMPGCSGMSSLDGSANDAASI
jgi:hypothetical protein